MAITTIPNQPVNFRSSTVECECLGQEYSQLVNKNDQTQYQISSTSVLTNGDFETDLTGWNVFEAIEVTAAITNESAEGACDGEIEVSATGGSGGYTYSIDGGFFGGSDTFTGLCDGTYLITVKDSSGNEGSLSVTIETNITCGSYAGSDTDDLLPLTTSQILNCLTSDFL
jgi:hypothetical protein